MARALPTPLPPGAAGVTVGPIGTHFALLPIQVVTHALRRVDTSGKNWNRLRASIGQPTFLPPDAQMLYSANVS